MFSNMWPWIASVILSLFATVVSVKTKADTLQKSGEKLDARMNQIAEKLNLRVDDAINRLNDAIQAIKVFSAEQVIINRVAAESIAGIATKFERVVAQINDVSTRVALIAAACKRCDDDN